LKGHDNWNKCLRKANITSVFKKGKKDDPGNYRPVILSSISGNMMEQLLLKTISWHTQGKIVMRSSQHGFMKGRSYSTILITFCDELTGLVGEGRAVNVVCLDSLVRFLSLFPIRSL